MDVNVPFVPQPNMKLVLVSVNLTQTDTETDESWFICWKLFVVLISVVWSELNNIALSILPSWKSLPFTTAVKWLPLPLLSSKLSSNLYQAIKELSSFDMVFICGANDS